jgi:hypothetical protein
MTLTIPSGPRAWLVGLLLATLTGGALRFAELNRQSFWFDEAFVDALDRSSYADIYTGKARDDGNPPLHFLVDKFVAEHIGTDEVSHRLVPALVGTLTVPLIGVLGRRLHSPTAGMIAAWLLAISPFQIEMSAENRVYSFLHFITTVNALLLVRWLSSRSWLDGLGYAVGTVVACYSHYYIVFVILAHAVVLLAQPDRWSLLWRWWVLMGLAALVWLPWAPAFVAQLRTPGNLSRMGGAWKFQFAATPVTLAVGRTFAWRESATAMLGLALGVSLIGYWVPAAIGLVRPTTPSPSPSPEAENVRRITVPLLAAWILLPILIPLAAALAGKPLYHHRAASVALPGFLLAVAIGLTRLAPVWRALAGLLILACTLFSLWNYHNYPKKDDWRSAVKAVMTDAPPGQVVLTDADIEAMSFLYYARQYHAIPEELYGLTLEPDRKELWGIRYEDGVKQDPVPKNYSDPITSASHLTICLCVPSVWDEAAHRSYFEGRGFEVTEVTQYYRITVIRFKKGK